MHASISMALATCLALAGVCASAQTSTPATGGEAVPGKAPARSSGASPQNPSVNGYQDTKPENTPGTKPRTRQDISGTVAMPSDPTGKDSMAKDNKPKHPATDGTKAPDPK